jgi:hypothetical protein
MNGQVRVLMLLLAIVALHLAACTYTLDDSGDDAGALHGMEVPASSETINIADAAGLNRTTEVQIFEQAETAIDMEIYLGAITEPDVLESLVGALDVDMADDCPTRMCPTISTGLPTRRRLGA